MEVEVLPQETRHEVEAVLVPLLAFSLILIICRGQRIKKVLHQQLPSELVMACIVDEDGKLGCFPCLHQLSGVPQLPFLLPVDKVLLVGHDGPLLMLGRVGNRGEG